MMLVLAALERAFILNGVTGTILNGVRHFK